MSKNCFLNQKEALVAISFALWLGLCQLVCFSFSYGSNFVNCSVHVHVAHPIRYVPTHTQIIRRRPPREERTNQLFSLLNTHEEAIFCRHQFFPSLIQDLGSPNLTNSIIIKLKVFLTYFHSCVPCLILIEIKSNVIKLLSVLTFFFHVLWM